MLRLNAHLDAVEVAVDDTSPRWPRVRTPDVTGSDGGFGWPMVNRLARTTAVTAGQPEARPSQPSSPADTATGSKTSGSDHRRAYESPKD